MLRIICDDSAKARLSLHAMLERLLKSAQSNPRSTNSHRAKGCSAG